MNDVGSYTVITGASAGIGCATAKAFATRGKNLILIARGEGGLEKVKAEILAEFPSLHIILRCADLSASETCVALYDSLKEYHIETWINNAGIGYYGYIAEQDIDKILHMMHLNMDAVAILSSLYVRDYRDVAGTQLINVSSSAGYTIVPYDVAYSATKFFVGAFTEGLGRELQETNAKMMVKVLAPSATETNFARIANGIKAFDYAQELQKYHTAERMAEFLMQLYDSNHMVGLVERMNYDFVLCDPIFSYAAPLRKKTD